jgi:hypothetical protein
VQRLRIRTDHKVQNSNKKDKTEIFLRHYDPQQKLRLRSNLF